MQKPKWMAASEWSAFYDRFVDNNGNIACVTCDATSDTAVMSVDHIRPRHDDGSDDLSNLQPMCVSCNAKKNKHADSFWKRRFYFDGDINEQKLRASQYDFVMGPVKEYEEFFAQPWSSINGKLFSYAQIVGAGKTLGMFALPIALNAAVNQQHAASPRTSKVLIVTKEQALRDQIAREIEHEPVDFGIASEAPRVKVIKQSSQLADDDDAHDFAVMCPNMLWPNTSNDEDIEAGKITWSPHVETVLRRYDVIIFDEMHYAHKNIRHLVNIARHQLVFGFTASPVKSNGDLLEDMVLMGQPYGYREAIINDQSMKGIW